jgi:hypothetical protein
MARQPVGSVINVQTDRREIGRGFTDPPERGDVSPEVERTNPDGIDYGWVMQVTFVTTIVVGAPIVAALSLTTELPTWSARASFAIRVGAVVWFAVAVAVYLYARSNQRE